LSAKSFARESNETFKKIFKYLRKKDKKKLKRQKKLRSRIYKKKKHSPVFLQRDNFFKQKESSEKSVVNLSEKEKKFISDIFFASFKAFYEEAHSISFAANTLFLGFFEKYTQEFQEKINNFSAVVERLLTSFFIDDAHLSSLVQDAFFIEKCGQRGIPLSLSLQKERSFNFLISQELLPFVQKYKQNTQPVRKDVAQFITGLKKSHFTPLNAVDEDTLALGVNFKEVFIKNNTVEFSTFRAICGENRYSDGLWNAFTKTYAYACLVSLGILTFDDIEKVLRKILLTYDEKYLTSIKKAFSVVTDTVQRILTSFLRAYPSFSLEQQKKYKKVFEGLQKYGQEKYFYEMSKNIFKEEIEKKKLSDEKKKSLFNLKDASFKKKVLLGAAGAFTLGGSAYFLNDKLGIVSKAKEAIKYVGFDTRLSLQSLAYHAAKLSPMTVVHDYGIMPLLDKTTGYFSHKLFSKDSLLSSFTRSFLAYQATQKMINPVLQKFPLSHESLFSYGKKKVKKALSHEGLKIDVPLNFLIFAKDKTKYAISFSEIIDELFLLAQGIQLFFPLKELQDESLESVDTVLQTFDIALADQKASEKHAIQINDMKESIKKEYREKYGFKK
jgi:hypothetical protein